MGRWLDLVDRLEKEKRERERGYDKNDINDKSPINSCASDVGRNQEGTFGRINRLYRTAGEEERRIIEWLDISDFALPLPRPRDQLGT